MTKHDNADLLKQVLPFWNRITPEQQRELSKNTRQVSYKQGENIHGANHSCPGPIIVRSGKVRAYMLSDQGKDITLYRLFPNDLCMLSASCVIDAITFQVFIDAEVDTEAVLINPNVFSRLSKGNVYVENFALQTATARFSEVMWTMQQMLFMSFDKRLAVFLTDELARTGGDTVSLTQEQIAKYMSSAREVVSRMLKHFSSEGIVEISRGEVKVIDKQKLRNLTI